VSQKLLDIDALALEDQAHDQAVLVAANVKDRQRTDHVSRWVHASNVFEVLPPRFHGDPVPHSHWRNRIGIVNCFLEEFPLADHVQQFKLA
jgi:hypothetical protein